MGKDRTFTIVIFFCSELSAVHAGSSLSNCTVLFDPQFLWYDLIMGRRLIVGDIHACINKLEQALERANFCPESDTLYSVGDLCDRGFDPVKTLDFVYSLPNFKPVLGNHDLWLLQHYHPENYRYDSNWIDNNGGSITLNDICYQPEQWGEYVYERLMNTPFSIVLDDYIIVHGGIPESFMDLPLSALDGVTPKDTGVYTQEYRLYSKLCWDRTYYKKAKLIESKRPGASLDVSTLFEVIPWDKELIIGHTPVRSFLPFFSEDCRLINIDTAGFHIDGKITVMDMETKEYWQSDTDLY